MTLPDPRWNTMARSARRRLRSLRGACAVGFLIGWLGVAPHAQGSDAAIGTAPDYGQADHWLALPDHPSAAMATPRGAGFSDLQAQAVADVFYVHPTTAMREDVRNASLDDADANHMAELMLLTQATPFNAVARVYAPRYRQITLSTYALDAQAQQAPLNLAYADVLAAFRHYATHYNQGRPFFLVGHSQGTNHAQRLLLEAIQGTPMEDLLVAAYLPGQPIPRAFFRDDLIRLPPCERPSQVGCVAIWQTFGEGAQPEEIAQWRQDNAYWSRAAQRWIAPPDGPLAGMNPVSWDARRARTPARRHRGAVPFGTRETYAALLPQQVSTILRGGYTRVSPGVLPATCFDDGGVFGGRNLHVFDIALFWLDLRENARLRLNAWRLRHGAREPLLGATARVQAPVGRPWHHRIAVRNPVVSFEVMGLPPGLALDERRGVIHGTVYEAGTFALRISASNAHGSDHAELALVVMDAGR